jgi:hypothetical protein
LSTLFVTAQFIAVMVPNRLSQPFSLISMPDICLSVFFPNTQFYLLTITAYATVWCVSSSQRSPFSSTMDLTPTGDCSLITSLLQVGEVSNTSSFSQMYYNLFYTANLRSTGKYPFPRFFLHLAWSGILGLYPTLYPFKVVLRNYYTNGDATSY